MDCCNSVVCIFAVFIGICFVLFGLACLFCVIVCLCWVFCLLLICLVIYDWLCGFVFVCLWFICVVNFRLFDLLMIAYCLWFGIAVVLLLV